VRSLYYRCVRHRTYVVGLADVRFQHLDLVVLTTLIGVDEHMADDGLALRGLCEGKVERRTAVDVGLEDRIHRGGKATQPRVFVFAVFAGLQGARDIYRMVRLDRAAVNCGDFRRRRELQVPVQAIAVLVRVDGGLDDLQEVVSFGEKRECGVDACGLDLDG